MSFVNLTSTSRDLRMLAASGLLSFLFTHGLLIERKNEEKDKTNKQTSKKRNTTSSLNGSIMMFCGTRNSSNMSVVEKNLTKNYSEMYPQSLKTWNLRNFIKYDCKIISGYFNIFHIFQFTNVLLIYTVFRYCISDIIYFFSF